MSWTNITDVSSLSGLTNLQSLDLRGTKITDVSSLSGLINLQSLHLVGTDITDVSSLSGLTNLQSLGLRGTKITDVSSLSGLTNLQSLDLSWTKITDASSLSGLTNLQSLDLSWTKITDVSSLSGLINLQSLDLSGTEINILPRWLGQLQYLRMLDLSFLNLQFIPGELLQIKQPFNSDDYFGFKNGILLFGTTVKTQPISLFEQPIELIQAYYEAEQVPVNEAKVIFLGDGGAGKTHTIKRIHNGGKKEDYETETTPGIDITNYTAEHSGQKFNIHFWDFGGQEIMHAMHRCFLTERTCYVVVVSNRMDLNDRARYWLKNIDSFAKGAPVILAVNRWDNIQETGIDMSRLTKDYPNLLVQPVYYSAKNSSDAEFQNLINVIIREAGKLDSAAMSFPAQWYEIRQELLNTAEMRHYIDKEEYHRICERQGLSSLQIRRWLLEWFNDLGICFSYHQDESEKGELASYKILNPRWLTNAIYIIINADKKFVEKGRINRKIIEQLLKDSKKGVLPGVTYSEKECGYVLEVMRKFNLSYSVSEKYEFIPALCDSETPKELHPVNYDKRISYQMKYGYLPDSVVHQLMIRSYKNLNPEKIWRKGLRIDIELVDISAVVDMGDDDATLRIDIYASGRMEPWIVLNNIRKDIVEINRSLGLAADDYIIIHTDAGDIPVTVDSLLAAKEQGRSPVSVYNKFSRKWEDYSVDELLGSVFGKETIINTVNKAREENKALHEVFERTSIVPWDMYYQNPLPAALGIIELLIRNNCDSNERVMRCLVDALNSADSSEAKQLADEVERDYKGNEGFLKRLETYIKSVGTIVANGKTIYAGVESVARAIETAYPKIQEHLPQIIEGLQNIPFMK